MFIILLPVSNRVATQKNNLALYHKSINTYIFFKLFSCLLSKNLVLQQCPSLTNFILVCSNQVYPVKE